MKSLLLSLFVVLSLIGQAQPFFISFHGIVTDHHSAKPMRNALVHVTMKDGKHVSDVITKRKGTYHVRLEKGRFYVVEYSKTGYVTKFIEVDTRDIPDSVDVPFYDMDVQMSLFEQIPDFDMAFFDEPIGIAEFKQSVRTVNWDNPYSEKKKDELVGVMHEYTKTYRGYYARTKVKPRIVIADSALVLRPDSDDVAVVKEAITAFQPSDTASSYYNDSTAAPAVQVETIAGLFFAVQVGVYSRPTALDLLYNITPLNSELMDGGRIRYTSGQFDKLTDSEAYRKKVVALGVKDAFTIAYFNGKRVPLQDAIYLLQKFGDDVLIKR